MTGKKLKKEKKSSGEHHWRFLIENDTPAGASPGTHPMVDFVRLQLQDLLEYITPTYQGEKLKIDGFTFVEEEETIYKLYQ